MKYIFMLLLSPAVAFSQSPQEILKKAVEYHDPEGQWKTLKATFSFVETRPGGEDRQTILELNNAANEHIINRNGIEIYRVNGKGEVDIMKGDGERDRGKLLRNYYVFLWGLPMKLMDKGTPVQPTLRNQKIKDIDCFGVEVKYEKETYTFFFSRKNYRMVAYQFYNNDDSGKGEMILLEDEVDVQGMKIPQKRSWYELPGNTYLGTDILSEVK